jgi:cell fate regulator YaaT (PSP1 superfamily)
MYSEHEAVKSRGCCAMPSDPQKNEIKSSHNCCKLDAYDWLSDLNLSNNPSSFDIVEVRFKNNRKEFFRLNENGPLQKGDIVAVESSPGHDIGVVSLTGEIVRIQMRKKKIDLNSPLVKKIYRKARQSDVEKWMQAAAQEIPTMIQTRRVVDQLGLQMKINDVEYQGDKTKAIFYYTAEGRIDFRELIKILAEKNSVRIEMKQIGVRQESARLGGIGSCGRELCCSSWLTDFQSVSTISARTQQLSMNPQKLAGQCGKLKCCLNFEYETYKEELDRFPATHIRLQTKKGPAFFQKMDVLSGMMYYSYVENPSVFIGVKREEVEKIQKMNSKGQQPEYLDELTEGGEDKPRYDNVMGQDDITRFDRQNRSQEQRDRPRENNGQRDQQRQRPRDDRRPHNQGDRKSDQPYPQRNENRNEPRADQRSDNRNQPRPENRNQGSNETPTPARTEQGKEVRNEANRQPRHQPRNDHNRDRNPRQSPGAENNSQNANPSSNKSPQVPNQAPKDNTGRQHRQNNNHRNRPQPPRNADPNPQN